MAIDSEQKRWSAQGVMRPWKRASYPTGTTDAPWRLSAANAYASSEDLEFKSSVTLKMNRQALTIHVDDRCPQFLAHRRLLTAYVRKNKPGSIGQGGGYGNL